MSKAFLNYRQGLEKSAKQMILIHRVDVLVKLILRTITANLKLKHAGFLLYDKTKDVYVIRISRGEKKSRIPADLLKVSKNNPLIKYFTDEELKVFGSEFLLLSKLNNFLKSKKIKNDKNKIKFFKDLKFQFQLYGIEACVSGFFRDKLNCMLFLGGKLDRGKFTAEELGFMSVLSSDVVMAIQNAWTFQDLAKQFEINRNLFLQIVMSLVTAIEAKHKYTSGHTERVSHYSIILAKEIKVMRRALQNNWDKFFEDLKIASLLHDVGKIGVREEVLEKRGALDDFERKEIQNHTLVGWSILCQIEGFQNPVLGVKYHHERHDGKGYPEGLKGADIPLIARIISIADTFDAMITNRAYRSEMSREDAVEEIKNSRGKQFSPLVVDAFLRAYNKGKI